MPISTRNVITIAVSLMVIALILPLGLGLIAIAGDNILVPFNITGVNESAVLLKNVIDPSVLTLLTILIPVLAVIGIAVSFISTKD